MKNDEMKKALEVVDSELKKLESQEEMLLSLQVLVELLFLAGGTEVKASTVAKASETKGKY